MWIHIPLAYVQDTGESNWDSSQSCHELEQSATWKTKSVRAKSWEHVLETESLTMLLSGLTLEPSMRKLGVEKYISSLEDSPVNRIQLQEENEEQTIQENCQEKSCESQMNSDAQLSFWRTLKQSNDSTGTPSDLSFTDWDTKLKKEYSVRKKQAHHTDAEGSLYWPTMTTQEYPHLDMKVNEKGRREPKKGNTDHSLNLQDRARVHNWRTPSSTETEGGVKDFTKKIGLGGQTAQFRLRDQVSTWATPASRDWKGMDSPGKQNPAKDPELYLSIRPDQTIHEDGSECTPKCRRLSPHFAEWLMGLPHKWTDSSEPLAMESFLQWQEKLGRY